MLFRSLRVAGLRLVCLTNKEERFARRVLQQTRLDGYFELLIGGDTYKLRVYVGPSSQEKSGQPLGDDAVERFDVLECATHDHRV